MYLHIHWKSCAHWSRKKSCAVFKPNSHFRFLVPPKVLTHSMPLNAYSIDEFGPGVKDMMLCRWSTSIMAQLDLGRVTLRIRDSQLQLHLTAAVRFSRSQKQDTTRNQKHISQISHLVSNWVTEAPDMELRFFIGGDWVLRSAVDTLVTGLKDKICGLKARSKIHI